MTQQFPTLEGQERTATAPRSWPSEKVREELARAAATLSSLYDSSVPLTPEEADIAIATLSELVPAHGSAKLSDPEVFRTVWNALLDHVSLPGAGVSLEESIYKEWTRDESHPLAGQKGLCLGDPANHVTAVMASFGLSLQPGEFRSPDHLSVLLEFLAFLLENRPPEEAARFCMDHLDWLPDLRVAATQSELDDAFIDLVTATERLAQRVNDIGGIQ